MRITKLYDVSTITEKQVQEYWESAYARFETPEEEVAKFRDRLNRLGQKEWKRNIEIVDIFSGRCNGIRALEDLGFTKLEGVDISPNLLAKYDGKAKLYVADCRELPFESKSRDLIIVQGGLHHLPKLPEDLEKTLSEIKRVLRDNGRFVMVEPWETNFLKTVHLLSEISLVRMVSNKFDAFATMTHYEANTYYNWLNHKNEILELLNKSFTKEIMQIRFGKINFVGRNQ